MKTILTIAAGFVTSIGVIPLKELNTCRDRLGIYRQLRADIMEASESEKQRIESVVWEAVKKIAIG